jgi:hypothetical protein
VAQRSSSKPASARTSAPVQMAATRRALLGALLTNSTSPAKRPAIDQRPEHDKVVELIVGESCRFQGQPTGGSNRPSGFGKHVQLIELLRAATPLRVRPKSLSLISMHCGRLSPAFRSRKGAKSGISGIEMPLPRRLSDSNDSQSFRTDTEDPLSDISTFDGATLAGLGVTDGTYVWTWGTGADADSFTLQIGPPPTGVLEPASLALFCAGVVGLGLIRRKRTLQRRKRFSTPLIALRRSGPDRVQKTPPVEIG